MSTLRHILIAAAFVTAAPLCEPRTAMAADGDKPAERFISVSATGSVDAEPDLASVSAGVIVEADTAKEALQRSSTVMVKLIDGLKALGIASKDIRPPPSTLSRATRRPGTAAPPPSSAIASSTACI